MLSIELKSAAALIRIATSLDSSCWTRFSRWYSWSWCWHPGKQCESTRLGPSSRTSSPSSWEPNLETNDDSRLIPFLLANNSLGLQNHNSKSPSMSPNNRIKYSREMVWNVMPMTLHTNLRTESKKPVTSTTNSGDCSRRDQNSSKSHFSKMSAKCTISWMVSSSISAGSSKHLHSVKSVCGKLVRAFNSTKLVTSLFIKCGLNWYDFSTAKLASKS